MDRKGRNRKKFLVVSVTYIEDRKNRVRKRRAVRRIYGMKYSWTGHKDRNRHKNRIKSSGQAWLVYVRHKPQHPHHVKVSPRGLDVNTLAGLGKLDLRGSNKFNVFN